MHFWIITHTAIIKKIFLIFFKFKMDDNFNPFDEDKNNINDPFANEDSNEEFSNPFQSELKNNNTNNNNSS